MSVIQLKTVFERDRIKKAKVPKKIQKHSCDRIWLPFLQGSMLGDKICEHFCFPKKKNIADLPIPTHDGPLVFSETPENSIIPKDERLLNQLPIEKNNENGVSLALSKCNRKGDLFNKRNRTEMTRK